MGTGLCPLFCSALTPSLTLILLGEDPGLRWAGEWPHCLRNSSCYLENPLLRSEESLGGGGEAVLSPTVHGSQELVAPETLQAGCCLEAVAGDLSDLLSLEV